MTADPSDTTSEHGSPKPGATATARRLAEGTVADVEQAAWQAQVEKLTQVLLLLANGEPAEG